METSICHTISFSVSNNSHLFNYFNIKADRAKAIIAREHSRMGVLYPISPFILRLTTENAFW